MSGQKTPDVSDDLAQIIANLEQSLAMARAARLDRTVVLLEFALAEARSRALDDDPDNSKQDDSGR